MTRTRFACLPAALAIMLLLMAAAWNPEGACAQSPAQARQTLETAVSTILNIIRNPQYANPATRAPLRKQIENEVHAVFDFGEFSSRTVGPRWRTFSQAQKQNFENAFADLLLNTYLSKVTGYNGETVAYTGETASPDGDKVEVRTVITMKDSKKTPVSYRMLYKNGKWVVYDVIIENISLVKNYRTQFQDILNSASPEDLTARVLAKAREVAATPGKAE